MIKTNIILVLSKIMETKDKFKSLEVEELREEEVQTEEEEEIEEEAAEVKSQKNRDSMPTEDKEEF